MKNNKYLVIKLSDDWIKNEQLSVVLKRYAKQFGASVLENAIVPLTVSRAISTETLSDANYYEAIKEFTKKEMAIKIADYLMEQDYVRFDRERIGEDLVLLRATVGVVKEKENG